MGTRTAVAADDAQKRREQEVTDRKYWFPPKKYGWGWGWPCAWQGWVVYVVAFGLLVAGPFLFSPFRQPVAFQLYTWAVILVLVLVCWLKGAPPGWR